MEEKNKGGRPKLTLEDLPKNWQDKFAEMYAEGASHAEVRGWLARKMGTYSIGTWERFKKDCPEFLEAIQLGLVYSHAWWAAQGRKGVWGGKDFNANGYRFQVMNRFPDHYRDKQTVEVTTFEQKLRDAVERKLNAHTQDDSAEIE